jgi:hypothetical protein
MVICIAGMHRSGTSLTAGLLNKAGLNLGEDLLSGKFDNAKGHYEDLEFLRFHQAVLKSRVCGSTGLYLSKNFSRPFSIQENEMAKRMLQRREMLSLWGWKEPRSTLFLLEWKRLIPQLKVVAVYREPSAVIDSLLRRTNKLIESKNTPIWTKLFWRFFRSFKIQREIENYERAYIAYNQELLNFHQKYPEDIIFISSQSILNHSIEVLNYLSDRFSIGLQLANIEGFVDLSLMREQIKSTNQLSNKSESNALFEQMDRLAQKFD